MRKTWARAVGALAILSLLAGASAGDAQIFMGAMLLKRLASRKSANPAPQAPAKQTIAYGSDPMQNMDFTPAQGTKGPTPLVIFVHGGGWTRGNKDNATGTWKAPHYTANGYAFASINYRLVPAARVEDEAADVAAALAKLIADADKLGIDRSRIVLMGHSAGAHLVALVGTDESYLRAAGLSFGAIAGVIPIDGAAYDVPKQMAQAGNYMLGRYDEAFGKDPARQQALSPTFHAQAPNAPRFLLLYVQRPDGMEQSKALAAALEQAGTPVQQNQFEGTGLKGHMTINRSLGDPSYAATPVVDAWLKSVFGK